MLDEILAYDPEHQMHALLTPLIVLGECNRYAKVDTESHIETKYIGLEFLCQSPTATTIRAKLGGVDWNLGLVSVVAIWGLRRRGRVRVGVTVLA